MKFNCIWPSLLNRQGEPSPCYSSSKSAKIIWRSKCSQVSNHSSRLYKSLHKAKEGKREKTEALLLGVITSVPHTKKSSLSSITSFHIYLHDLIKDQVKFLTSISSIQEQSKVLELTILRRRIRRLHLSYVRFYSG